MQHNVFISWSGIRARKLAEAISEFLPDVIQAAKPWISFRNIDKGRRWNAEIAAALQHTRIGIICVTSENLNEPWLLFEAGALAKAVDTAFVCPYLLDLEPKDIASPLADFQHTVATKDDTRRMTQTLNTALGEQIEAERLNRAYERCWPPFAEKLEQLRKDVVLPPAVAPRTDADLLSEMLERLRGLERKLELPVDLGSFERSQLWQKFLDGLAAKGAWLYSAAKTAEPAVRGSDLILQFSRENATFAKLMAGKVDLLQTVAAEAAGQEMKVRVEIAAL